MDSRQLIAEYKIQSENGKIPVSVDFVRQSMSFTWIAANTQRTSMLLAASDTSESVIAALKRLQAYCRRKKRPFVFTVYP